jgi:alkylated DNA repair dioxygenase AlkB
MVEEIINSQNCIVALTRRWLEREDADKLLKEIQNFPWEQHNVTVFGKQYPQPRRIYACGDEGLVHNYSGLSLSLSPWPKSVEELRDRLSRETGVAFNSCLLNEYTDGNKHVGYHSDKDLATPDVVTVTLGEGRDFCLKHKETKEVIKCIPRHGDALLMTGDTQDLWWHSVPKRKHASYRVSLTFRVLIH